MNGRLLAITSMFMLFALSGCGSNTVNNSNQPASARTTTSGQAKATSNPPFQNKLELHKVTPNDNFEPKPVDFRTAKVVSPDGREVTLDLTKQPVFFEAYWCPHCQRTLVMFNQNKSSLREPIVVATGFVPNTTLHDAEALVSQEEQALHIHFNQVYYLLDTDELAQLVQLYPTLYFPHNGKVALISGENTLDVWKQALSQH